MLEKTIIRPMFPKTFQPGCIGNLWLKNRLVKAATGTRLASLAGEVSEAHLRFYREIARGGAGLVIVEVTHIDDKSSKGGGGVLGNSRPGHRPGLSRLASIIKDNGAGACLQIYHSGITPNVELPRIKGPSRLTFERLHVAGAPLPEELTGEEIGEIVDAFGEAALRAKQGGFDMVELHGAHGYLITNFLSSYYNRRTDWYGGSLKNRMRLLLEIVENVRRKAGAGFPLAVKLSWTDYAEENPITLEETREVAIALEKAGVSAIEVSAGDHGHRDRQISPQYWPPGGNIPAAAEIKRAVSIPVIVVGGFNSPELVERPLAEGKADFVSLARPLLADPYFPLKAREGRPEDITPCIQCLECMRRGIQTRTITCAVNVNTGKEADGNIAPAPVPKKVAVIGGGPAGMEAARVAALRGHEVTLFEKRQLGGLLVEASVPEFKADLRPLISYLATQVKKAGVRIINSEATRRTIKNGKFDVAIVAAGGVPRLPDVHGLDKPVVTGGLAVLGGARTGKRVIVVGGGLVGCDVALFLAEQGTKVTIIEMLDGIARDIAYDGFTSLIDGTRLALLARLSRQPVEVFTGWHLEAVTGDGIVAGDRCGASREFKGDNVVMATGFAPNLKLFDRLAELPDLEVYAVGDCARPRRIYDAIHEGHAAAYRIV